MKGLGSEKCIKYTIVLDLTLELVLTFTVELVLILGAGSFRRLERLSFTITLRRRDISLTVRLLGVYTICHDLKNKTYPYSNIDFTL